MCTGLEMGLVVCSPLDVGMIQHTGQKRCARPSANAVRDADSTGVINGARGDNKQCIDRPLFNVRPSVFYEDSQKNRQEMVVLYQDYMTDHTVCDPPIMMCWIDSNMIIKTLF